MLIFVSNIYLKKTIINDIYIYIYDIWYYDINV